MERERVYKLTFSIALAAAGLSAAESQASLEARLNQSAAGFHTMTAKITRVQYTAVIKDTSTETGQMWMKRVKAGDTRVRIDFEDPDKRNVVYQNRKGEVFNPKINVVQEFDLAKYRNMVDQFLLLGFGTSAKALAQEYTIKVLREETIAGMKTTLVELTPKSAQFREQITKVEMWIQDGDAYPVRQKFHKPSGYEMTTYADLKVNAPVPDEQFKLKLPKGAKREKLSP